jgi:hypothetical protein
MVIAGGLLAADPAAAAITPDCTQSGATVTCTVAYAFTGGEQEFTVPSGITSLTAAAIGGSGGDHIGQSSSGTPGGLGASVSASFTVTPGQTLFVEVGGNGSDWVPSNSAPGGFNGGGSAPSYFQSFFDLGGAGGGGASDIRTEPATNSASLSSRLLVAGGGGGSSIDGSGGNAGSDASASHYNSGGFAGTSAAGGAGGSGGGSSGSSGTLGSGGAGGVQDGGAGGGGGLYGGGGGATYGGGGGGSSLGTVNGVTGNAASVTLIYSPAISSLAVTSSSASVTAGGSAALSSVGSDAAADSWDATSATTFASSDGSDQVTGNSIQFGTSGPRTITGTNGSASGITTIVVSVGPATTLVVTASASSVGGGGTATFTAVSEDAGGDQLGDVTSATTFTSSNNSDYVTGNSIDFGTIGTRTISGTNGAFSDATTVTVTLGPIATPVIDPPSATITAGDTVVFSTSGSDAGGNPLGDVTGDTVFTSTRGSDTITGGSIRFITAGTDTVTATAGDTTATAIVTVGADVANPAAITLRVSDARVAQGGSITLAVTGTDAYGNAIPGLTDQATFTSDWAVDEIHGSTITFPHASTHHITAALGALRSTVTITVVAPAIFTPLAFTGVDFALPIFAGLSALPLGLLAIGVTLWVRRRRSA